MVTYVLDAVSQTNQFCLRWVRCVCVVEMLPRPERM
jgi:hypothetical protein